MKFGVYTLIERLAKGGMAEVFRARRSGAEGFVKEVAIKRILPKFSSDEGFVRMFINEARLAAELTSRNIVQIHDFDHVDGIYYIAMELVEGRDLRRVLLALRERGRVMPMEVCLFVVSECLKGLLVAHEKRGKRGENLGLIHRDVSPHNILLSHQGEVKLSDFGIAKAAFLQHSTSSDVIRGKLPYMSPEQVTSRPLDQRTDLFSLGIVLFELACRRRLYHPASSEGLLMDVARAEIPDPASLNAEISPALRRVILGLLTKNLARRLGSAREVIDIMQSEGLVSDQGLALASLMEQLFPRDAEAARRVKKTIQTVEKEPSPTGRVGAPAQSLDPVDTGAHVQASGHQSPGAPSTRRSRPVWLGSLLAAVAIAAGGVIWLAVDAFTRFEDANLALSPADGRSQLPEAKGQDGMSTGNRSGPRSPASLPQSATAVIHSEPAGAQVRVDGVPTGHKTPVTIGLPAGRHRIEVRFAGGARLTRDETLKPGERRVIRLRLPRPSARAQARRPPRLGEPSGRHQVRPAPTPADSSPGVSMGRWKPRSGRLASRVDFACSPWALVHLRGRRIGQTPQQHKLPPGRYLARFSNPVLQKQRSVFFRVRGDGAPVRVDCGF